MRDNKIITAFDQKSIFKRPFALILIVIGTVVCLNVFFVIQLLGEQSVLKQHMNEAEEQRMLSQRITKSAFGLRQSDSISQKEFYSKELEFSVNQFQAVQEKLVSDLRLIQFTNGRSEALLDSMAPYYDEILKVTSLIINENQILNFENYDQLGLSTEYYSKYMDEFINVISDSTLMHSQKIVRLEWVFLVVIFGVLLGEYFLIFKPIKHQTIEAIGETKNLFDIAPTAIIIVDPKDFTIQEINDAGEALLQLNYEEALSMNLQDFISDETKRQIQRFSEKEHEHIIKGIEAVIKNRNRNEIMCLLSVGKFNFGGREHLLVGLADITAQKETEEAFERLATIDEMTGLYNRRTGLMMIAKEFEKAKRHIYNITICFIDMDGLKHVNDTFGHSEGDWYIRSIATVIREGIRQEDIGMRFGGDEIVIGFVNCDEVEAKQIVNRIQTVLDLIIETENKPYEMGISYGLSEYNKDVPMSVEAFINYADERMYAEKTLKKTTRR